MPDDPSKAIVEEEIIVPEKKLTDDEMEEEIKGYTLKLEEALNQISNLSNEIERKVTLNV